MSAISAPRPTNRMFAQGQGGCFLLCIDDTDGERSEERFVEAICADLARLGLNPDGEERQSARFGRYDGAFRGIEGRRPRLSGI